MRMIDGDKLLEWLESDQFDSPQVYRIINAIKLDAFDFPSNQGDTGIQKVKEVYAKNEHAPEFRMGMWVACDILGITITEGGNSDE